MQIPAEYICPLSKEIMEDPVRLKKCGHTFESADIYVRLYFKDDKTCPCCGVDLHENNSLQSTYSSLAMVSDKVNNSLTEPNDELKKEIDKFLASNPQFKPKNVA